MSDTALREGFSTTDKTVPTIAHVANLIGFWPVGLTLAIINSGKSQDWLQSHYQYMIRTVCIGLAFGLIASVLSFVLIGFLMFPVVVVWYVVRCIKGLMYLSREQAIANPKTWLF